MSHCVAFRDTHAHRIHVAFRDNAPANRLTINSAIAEKQAEQTSVAIFVCEHGAAKSILSAALFNKLARERRLNLRAIARGTDPDSEISPKVTRGLQADGWVASEPAPKKISKADLIGASSVITCHHA